MAIKLKTLSKTELKTLTKLKGEVSFRDSYGHRMRVGTNGIKACSVYNTSKWFNWTAKQRKEIKPILGEELFNKALQVWFLDFPKIDGFLDEMNYWVDKPESGTILAWNIGPDAKFILDGEELLIGKGEGLVFHLSQLHEVKRSHNGQSWICVMVRGAPEKFA